MNYINNLSKDASIVVNQNGSDWLAKVSQIANLSNQEIISTKQDILNTVSNVKTDIELGIGETLLGYVTQKQLDETVQDIKTKTDEQITVTLWHYCKKSEIDEIIELDYLVNYFNKEEVKTLFNSLQSTISNSVSNFYNTTEVDTKIQTVYNELDTIKNDYSELAIVTSRIFENVHQNILNNYYTKDVIEDKLSSLAESNITEDYVKNALSNYMTADKHNEEIQDVKLYADTQIAKTVAHYIKRNEVDTKLNTIKTTLNNTLSIKLSSYYTKKEIDKKFEDIGKAYVQILSPREYQTLKLYGQIKDNNLYLISKYGRPIELYIGKFLFAKRSDDVAIGFPYTFPLVF